MVHVRVALLHPREVREGDLGGDGGQHGQVDLDGEPGRQLQLDEVSEFVEMLELRRDHLQHRQQHVHLHGELLGHGHRGLEVFAACLGNNPPEDKR